MPLVLSRKRGERVRIGHDVTVEVVEVQGDRVRLMIDAPRNIPVHREELYHQIFVKPQQSGGAT